MSDFDLHDEGCCCGSCGTSEATTWSTPEAGYAEDSTYAQPTYLDDTTSVESAYGEPVFSEPDLSEPVAYDQPVEPVAYEPPTEIGAMSGDGITYATIGGGDPYGMTIEPAPSNDAITLEQGLGVVGGPDPYGGITITQADGSPADLDTLYGAGNTLSAPDYSGTAMGAVMDLAQMQQDHDEALRQLATQQLAAGDPTAINALDDARADNIHTILNPTEQEIEFQRQLDREREREQRGY